MAKLINYIDNEFWYNEFGDNPVQANRVRILYNYLENLSDKLLYYTKRLEIVKTENYNNSDFNGLTIDNLKFILVQQIHNIAISNYNIKISNNRQQARRLLKIRRIEIEEFNIMYKIIKDGVPKFDLYVESIINEIMP